MSDKPSDEYSFYLTIKIVSNYFSYIVVVIVFPLGFLLNTISILLFNRKNFSGETIKFYYKLILINNNLILVINFVDYVSISINYDIALLSNFTCILSQSSRIFTIFASWLQVMVTIDRFIHICYPHKFVAIKKIKVLLVIVLVIFLLCLAMSYTLFYNRVVYVQSVDALSSTTITTKVCTSPSDILFIRDTITAISRALIPFIIVLIINSILMFKLKRIKTYFLSNPELKKEYYFAYSIAAFNVFFLVTLVPYLCSCLLMGFVNALGFSIISRTYVISNMISNISITLTLYNFCFSFMINFKFNVLFREEVLHLYYKIKNYL